MIYIGINNKIIIRTPFLEHQEIINDTGYLPLCINRNTILMSSGELYTIIKKCPGNYELSKINMENNSYYCIESYDFADTFAKINSEYYEIRGTLLHKIPIVANKSGNIIKYTRYDNIATYCYINTDNQLIFFDSSDESSVILEYNIDSILSYTNNYSGGKIQIIYNKGNNVIYSAYDNNKLIPLQYTYIIDYNGSVIVKSLGNHILDSDHKYYEIRFNGYKFVMTKIFDNVIDFNNNDGLQIINSEHKICQIDNTDSYNLTLINNYGHFRKNICNTKSAKNLKVTQV